MKRLVFVIGLIGLWLIKPARILGAFTNEIPNSGFESNNLAGWSFGSLNRAIYPNSTYPGAYQGNYWLDVSDCSSCGDNGLGKSITYDISEKLAIGQRYQASIYFRSPTGGSVEFVAWATGGETEIFSSGVQSGNGDWKRLEVNAEIKNSHHDRLRLQVYLKGDLSSKQYQFDELSLINKPWVIGHRYLYHHIPGGLYWSGQHSNVFEGWNECYVCGGRPGGKPGNKDADPRKIIGPEPWRREIGSGDGVSYPYLGIYDDSNSDMIKYQALTQKSAGIDAWAIAFWSDGLPRKASDMATWYFKPLVQLVNEYSPYFKSIGFKFYVIDEMTYNWGSDDDPPDTQRMKDHAIALLTTFRNHEAYLRINGKMVYFLPIIDKYKKQNKIGELRVALDQIEASVGQEIYWFGYSGNLGDYSMWKDSGIDAFLDGYGLTGSIFDDKNTAGKIDFYSGVSSNLADNGLGMVMTAISAFVNQYFNGDTARTYTRNNGARWTKSLDVANSLVPRPVAIQIHEAEWQEAKMIEPCVSFGDDTTNDPFKYLKTLGQKLKKINYVDVPLPPAEVVDPLRAGEVYGRNANIAGVNLVNSVGKGQTFEVEIKAINTGGAPWTRQTLTYDNHGWYRLKIDFDGQTKYVDLDETDVIKEGQEKIFTANLTAPQTEKNIQIKAKMIQQDFEQFGNEIV